MPLTAAELNAQLSRGMAQQSRADAAWHKSEMERVRSMFPLPLASDVGLDQAYRSLRSFPWSRSFDWPDDLKSDPRMLAAAELWDTHVDRRSTFWSDHPMQSEHTLPPPDGVSPLVIAVTAAEQVGVWQARRQVANTRDARRKSATWAQLAAEYTPEAVRIADRVASAVNDAAQSVSHPLISESRRTPSWR